MPTLFKPGDWPIFVKLLAVFIILALLALVPSTLANQQQARQGLLKEAQRNLANTSRNTAQNISDYIKARSEETFQSANADAVRAFMNKVVNDRSSLGPNDRDQRDTLALLNSRALNIGADAYTVVASIGGQVELTSEKDGGIRSGEPINIGNSLAYKAIAEQKQQSYISDPVLAKLDETTQTVDAYLYFANPLKGPSGELIGIIITRIDLEHIWSIIIRDKEAAGPGSYTMLVDNNGVRLGDSRATSPQSITDLVFTPMYNIPANEQRALLATGRYPSTYPFSVRQSVIPEVADRARTASFDASNIFFDTKLDTANFSVAYARADIKPWSYFVLVPESTFAAAANDIATLALVIGLVFLVLVILLATILSRLLTRPVRQISSVLGRIGIGDFDARVNVTNRDELGRLGESLNAMFDNTLALIQTREEKEVLQDRITQLLNEISTVAEGDLTAQAEVTADITGAIADSFNLMIEELRKIISNIQNATTQTTQMLDQVVANSHAIDQAADRQANRIMGVTSSVNEMNISIQRVSASAGEAAGVAQEARSNARSGGEAVTKTIGSMNRIRGNVQETAKKIKRLGESSQQIGEIVKLIDDIADQTNMLALNAAIEAAKAGEQGKGFSVVTDEVRRLATRSANAAREIAGLVKSIQDDTNAAVVAMEESTSEVVEGSRVADDAGKALSEIETVVEQLANLIQAIATVSQQQAGTSTNIAQSMEELALLTTEAATLRQRSTALTSRVARTAEALRSSVSAFKVAERAPSYAPLLEENPRVTGETFTPIPSSLLVQAAQGQFGDDRLPINEKPADLNISSLLAETDDAALFDSMFEEVGTSRGTAPTDKDRDKFSPQALG